MRNYPAILLGLALAGGGMNAGRGAEPADFSRIRGANYVPSYGANTVAAWKNFDPAIIDREVGFAEKARLNSVRVFLQFAVYEKQPREFLGNVERFVSLCEKHRIRPMLVLFDSCFGEEPDYSRDRESQWFNCPGYRRIEGSMPALEKYASDVVSRFRGDRRVLMWDVMNEPEADFTHPGDSERQVILKFCRRMCELVKRRDPTHPITVGHAVVECIPTTQDLVDVLSVHSYAPYRDWFARDLELAQRYGMRASKPVIVTECGNPGEHQSYELALDVIEEKRMGFFFWELMIGKVVPFNELAGIFYPDGTVRDLASAARIAGFKSKREGGIPLKTTPGKEPQRKFMESPEKWDAFLKQAASVARTRDQILPVLEGVAMIAREKGRGDDTARQAFMNALSAVHLFKLGRDGEAVDAYERLLKLAGSVAVSK